MTGFVRARIDEDLRIAASAVLEDFGLSVSDIIRVVLTRVAKDGAVPLGLFIPNAVTSAAMQEAREIMAKKEGTFTGAQEMFSALDAKKEQKQSQAAVGM